MLCVHVMHYYNQGYIMCVHLYVCVAIHKYIISAETCNSILCDTQEICVISQRCQSIILQSCHAQ